MDGSGYAGDFTGTRQAIPAGEVHIQHNVDKTITFLSYFMNASVNLELWVNGRYFYKF